MGRSRVTGTVSWGSSKGSSTNVSEHAEGVLPSPDETERCMHSTKRMMGHSLLMNGIVTDKVVAVGNEAKSSLLGYATEPELGTLQSCRRRRRRRGLRRPLLGRSSGGSSIFLGDQGASLEPEPRRGMELEGETVKRSSTRRKLGAMLRRSTLRRHQRRSSHYGNMNLSRVSGIDISIEGDRAGGKSRNSRESDCSADEEEPQCWSGPETVEGRAPASFGVEARSTGGSTAIPRAMSRLIPDGVTKCDELDVEYKRDVGGTGDSGNGGVVGVAGGRGEVYSVFGSGDTARVRTMDESVSKHSLYKDSTQKGKPTTSWTTWSGARGVEGGDGEDGVEADVGDDREDEKNRVGAKPELSSAVLPNSEEKKGGVFPMSAPLGSDNGMIEVVTSGVEVVNSSEAGVGPRPGVGKRGEAVAGVSNSREVKVSKRRRLARFIVRRTTLCTFASSSSTKTNESSGGLTGRVDSKDSGVESGQRRGRESRLGSPTRRRRSLSVGVSLRGRCRQHRRPMSPEVVDPEKSLEGSEGAAGDQVDGTLTKRLRFGTSLNRRDPLIDLASVPWNTWGPGDASSFCLRSQGYARTRVKIPSSPELYELISVDVFRSSQRLCHVFPLLEPPCSLAVASEGVDWSELHSDLTSHSTPSPQIGGSKGLVQDGEGSGNAKEGMLGVVAASAASAGEVEGTGHPDIPPVFVMNVQLPNVATPLASQGDGPTIHVVFVLRAKEQLRRFAKRLAEKDKLQVSETSLRRPGEPLLTTASPGVASGPVLPCGDRTAGAQVDASQATVAMAGVGGKVSSGVATDGVIKVKQRGDGKEVGGEREMDYCGGRVVDNVGKGIGDEDRRQALTKEEKGSASGHVGGGGMEPGGAAARVEGGGEGEGEEEEEDEIPGSVRLLAEWIRCGREDSQLRGRFKAIGVVDNAEEVGLPSIAKKFNGKPVLVYGRECELHRGPGYAEVDLNGHAFSFIGRKGLYITLNKWKRAVFRMGFLIEGRSDEELPERILGCGILKGVDLEVIPNVVYGADGESIVIKNENLKGSVDRPSAIAAASTSSAAGMVDSMHSGTRGNKLCQRHPMRSSLISAWQDLFSRMWFVFLVLVVTGLCWAELSNHAADFAVVGGLGDGMAVGESGMEEFILDRARFSFLVRILTEL